MIFKGRDQHLNIPDNPASSFPTAAQRNRGIHPDRACNSLHRDFLPQRVRGRSVRRNAGT